MTKAEFIAKYESLITVYFDFEELVRDSNIILKKSDKPLAEFLGFYVPRYTKAGSWDDRPIEQIIKDRGSGIVRLKDIIASPAAWGLHPYKDADSLSKALWPVPLATDIRSYKTLILDSNHTICTMLTAGINIKIPCIELIGDDLSKLGVDIKLMQA